MDVNDPEFSLNWLADSLEITSNLIPLNQISELWFHAQSGEVWHSQKSFKWCQLYAQKQLSIVGSCVWLTLFFFFLFRWPDPKKRPDTASAGATWLGLARRRAGRRSATYVRPSGGNTKRSVCVASARSSCARKPCRPCTTASAATRRWTASRTTTTTGAPSRAGPVAPSASAWTPTTTRSYCYHFPTLQRQKTRSFLYRTKPTRYRCQQEAIKGTTRSVYNRSHSWQREPGAPSQGNQPYRLQFGRSNTANLLMRENFIASCHLTRSWLRKILQVVFLSSRKQTHSINSKLTQSCNV